MRILKNILLIIIIAAVGAGVFIYALNQESGQAAQTDNVIISEFMASNKSCIADEEGEYSDWIEIYNPTEQSKNLYGLGLSNEKDSVKWVLPSITLEPKGRLVVFASGKASLGANAVSQHASFKLKASGGGIYLTNSAGQIIDQIEYKDQQSNVSLGRDENDISQWLEFENATPGFSNDEEGFEAFKASRVTQVTGLIITEVMPSNKTVYADNNGNFNDYIEIYNEGEQAINLEGFCLSDNEDNISKWQFPAVTIEPGEYLTVFASGEDEQSTDTDNKILHTSFQISAYKETIIFADTLGLIIDSVTVTETPSDYAYSRIQQGDGSYGDEWEKTVYLSPGFANSAQGNAQFEQNQEVALGPIVINEVMISNSSYMQEEDGEYYDWIELYNSGDQAVDIGEYSLSDDPNYPVKFKFPSVTINAGEYLTVMASGLGENQEMDNADGDSVKKKYIHTNFKLSSSGEVLILFNSDVKVLDRYNLFDLPRDVSLGRMSNESALFYFTQPTPNAVNSSPSKGIVAAPLPKIAAGSYDAAQQITLSSTTPDAKIYYTLDGTEPTQNSTAYSAPVSMSATGMIRAVAVKDGYIQSEVTSNTYFIAEQHSLPLVSIVTDPYNLFDETTGIYELGPNPQLIEGSTTHYEVANYLEQGPESERPASFEVFDENGQQVFVQDVAIRIQGGFSRDCAQKSFAIMARSEYGKGSMEYAFFNDRPFTEYQSIILRQGGQDQNIAKIKEMVALSLVEGKGLNFLIQAWKPYVLYINGEYWGVYFMMEKRNEDFIAQHEGVADPDNMNIMQATTRLKQGSNEEYGKLLDYIRNNDMSQKENFDYIAKYIDTDSFMDEMICEIWVANSDYANMEFYQILPDGKWKQIYYDFCWTFGSSEYPNATHPTLKRRMDDDVTGSTVFAGLLAYKPWRDAFVERFAWALKEIYNPERVIKTIDEIADMIRDEMPAEKAKFGGSVESWEANLENMRVFAKKRGDVIEDQLRNVFSLSSEQKQMLEDAIGEDH